MPVVSVTRLHVRSWRYLPAVLSATLRSAWQARACAGNLAVSLLCENRNTYWTRTVWTDETAMTAFVFSGAHRHVMRRLLRWCDENSVLHWHQSSAAPPPWPLAHRRLRDEGRHFPAPAGDAFPLPRPPVKRWRELHMRRPEKEIASE